MPARLIACTVAIGVGLAVLVAAGPSVTAQVAAPRGQNIAPVYEGWERNPDGSFNLLFGYFNRNWEQRFDIPIGPDNQIEPDGPDYGQPTHFYPQRNRFLFKIRVPADFGDKELVWTLTSAGETERAYATLLIDYFIDDVVIMNNKGAGGAGGGRYGLVGNKPPELRVAGAPRRTVAVGQPLQLTAFATDDGIPRPRSLPILPPELQTTTPDSAAGLWLSWFVYRGPGRDVTFDPQQIDVWEDFRDGGNSYWSPGWGAPPAPPHNRWEATATFRTPGTYVLRAWADDGGLMSYSDVTVEVTGDAAGQDQ